MRASLAAPCLARHKHERATSPGLERLATAGGPHLAAATGFAWNVQGVPAPPSGCCATPLGEALLLVDQPFTSPVNLELNTAGYSARFTG
jgi:hypothetical protein